MSQSVQSNEFQEFFYQVSADATYSYHLIVIT